MIDTVSGYVFNPTHLKPQDRKPGISAFMRIRNGQDFLEQTIRTHIDHFDEIVAVYNQCTDRTEPILLQLAQEYGPKLRVVHYVDRVYPPGSEGHARTPPDSPSSLVNYYNFALQATSCQVATKLDDDHWGIQSAIAEVHARIHQADFNLLEFWGFSGLNLIRTPDGGLGIPAVDPISGNGDIGYFRVTDRTFFKHDRRFEKFNLAGLRRKFVGWTYWHLKYLKKGEGFANYELEQNPNSRYHERRRILVNSVMAFGEPCSFAVANRPKLNRRIAALISDKARFQVARDFKLITDCELIKKPPLKERGL